MFSLAMVATVGKDNLLSLTNSEKSFRMTAGSAGGGILDASLGPA